MSLKTPEFESQEMRCRAALKVLDVPEEVIWQFDGPILFQLAHLCCVIDQPMHWKDALRWIYDHRGEILEHARKSEIMKREQIINASTETDGTVN